MEGYLWKRGRKVPSMKRYYAVLKGTMLSFYPTQDEAQRSGAAPKRVVEITDLQMPLSSLSEPTHPSHIILKYLDAEGCGTLQCRAESIEMQQIWFSSVQYALKEPDRIAEEEIAEAQDEISRDEERHRQGVQLATEAVEAAGRHHREQANVEKELQQNRLIIAGLNTKLESAKTLRYEAKEKLQTLKETLEEEIVQTKNSSINQERERVAAKVEVADSVEATYRRHIELLQAQIKDISNEQLILVQRVQKCMEESKNLRQAATKSLEDAQFSKQRTRRLASWDDGAASTRRSHLDPLVEGYLLCQHPMRTTMHRRYYVLTGNTLCWYADQDAYVHKMEAPNGVLHVADVSEWDGRVRSTSPIRRIVVPFSTSPRTRMNEQYPNTFAVLTVEGKTLHCSAPLMKDQKEWMAALHIGLTMPPLSPHRARAAKSRRDSFDLLAATPPSPKRQSYENVTKAVANEAGNIATNFASSNKVRSEVVVEGYLVIKTSEEKLMKNRYCVLRALTLYTFATHQEISSNTSTLNIVKVSKWDGHAPILHYDHGFILQTSQLQSIHCSAPSSEEMKRWIDGVQQATEENHPNDKRDSQVALQSVATDQEDWVTKQLSYDSAQNKFLVVLQQYYSEHSPSKLSDVPMLLTRYQGREQALVEHLDRLYGTSMGESSIVQNCLAFLVTQSPSPPAILPQSIPDPLEAHSGDYSDWLTWNNDSTPSYCVLSGNRLGRFDSEARSRADAPLNVFLVTGIHDYPVPSPTRSGTRLENQRLQFFISGGNECLKSSIELLVLQATSTEAKQQWMTRLQNSIASVPKASESIVLRDSSFSSKQPQPSSLQRKLVEYYECYNLKRVNDVETILSGFAGRERQLLLALDATYGTEVSSDLNFAALLPPTGLPNATFYREGYLSVNHPLVIPSYRKCFCVLNGTTWQCLDSVNRNIVIMSDVAVNLHPVTTKLAEQLEFHLETQNNGVIFLRADAVEFFHDWTQVICTILARQSNVDVDGEEPVKDVISALEQLRLRIAAVFAKSNPLKVNEVDSLLQSFEGREGALLKQIDTVYKSELAIDPVCTSLCTVLATNFAENHQRIVSNKSLDVPSDANILMEGYLMKRGHKIPSMRKRYCVLVRNELSYYVTHDDSKNPNSGATTNRLGFFHVDIVSDWHGKTSTHTYKHAMELETKDGKTFFCAASSAKDKQKWIDAFHHGIALVQQDQRRERDDTSESEHDRRLRDQFRSKLADFYRVRNPSKLIDLDLLLSCYSLREFALLQAIDEAYGTNLATDESLLTLIPPHQKEVTALATLKLDGYLKKTSSNISRVPWKQVQSVYVAVDGLCMSLYATREEFQSRSAGAKEDMLILAIKDDNDVVANNCFAVETSDHEWLHFKASDAMEKRVWVQVLRAALDTVLAQSILAEEHRLIGSDDSDITEQGFLLLRMDFDCSQVMHWKRREVATALEECSVALENGNEIVIRGLTKGGETQTRFTVLNTRAWIPGARCWPVIAGNRAPRFPFQIVTQEQFILSCSAATDVERADWIRHLRYGAEQAAALELIEDQLLEIKAPLSPGHKSLIERQKQEVSDPRVVVSPQAVVAQLQTNHEVLMTGYLSLHPDSSLLFSDISGYTQKPHDFFVVLDVRAIVAIYTDESSYFHQFAPIYKAQAVELPDNGAFVRARPHSSKMLSRVQQFFPEATGDGSLSSDTFTVVLRVLDESNDTTASDKVKNSETLTAFLTAQSQHDQWMNAFAEGINYAKSLATYRDEKVLLSFAEGMQESSEDIAIGNVTNSNSCQGAENINDSGFDEISMTSNGSNIDAKRSNFAFTTAAMEGILTPWQMSGSHIRSSQMKATVPVYAVLIGCRLRCYSSQEAAATAASISASSQDLTLSVDDQPPSLDIEITACSSWEAPTTSWLALNKEPKTSGLKIRVKKFRCNLYFTAPTVDAKNQWIQAMHHELQYDTERLLHFSERQFTHDVTAHLAAVTDDESDNTFGSTDKRIRNQGYLQVRTQSVGSTWHERFVMLDDSTLTIYSEKCGMDDWSEEELFNMAMEKHKIVGVNNWHPVFTSLGRNVPQTGFRVETSNGVYLEIIAKTSELASQWKSDITAATTKGMTKSSISRDATLPFISGARMEGYLQVKDRHKSVKRGVKMKSLKRWKFRYCVLMGSHWLVYANQAQAVSSKQASSPVAVYELLGIAIDNNDGGTFTKTFINRVDGERQFKCRARSGVECKCWVNAVEDEVLVQIKTAEYVEKSIKDHETEEAARNAIKSKFYEVKSDARRLSMLLGEAIQSASGGLSSSEDDDDVEDEFTLHERSRSKNMDGCPDMLSIDKIDIEPQQKDFSILSFFTYCFRCIPSSSAETNGRNKIIPLGIPGYSSTAAACDPLYTCDYFENDGYRELPL
ncbi:putative pleckstrin domain, PH-like domain superfamily [Plasmopara halstedii]